MLENNIKDLNDLADKFDSYYHNLSDNKTLETVIKLFHTSKMRDIFDSYIEESVNWTLINCNEKLIEAYTKLLRNILKICNSIYNYTENDTGITDSEYDILLDFYKNTLHGENIITENLINDNEGVYHKYISLRGTLDKIYKITEEDILKNKSQKSLEDWITRTEKRYFDKCGKDINLMECDIIVMPKFDGVSCVFECDSNGNLLRALTRGDTSQNKAQDVTHIFKDIFKGSLTNQKYSYGEKTEVMMLDSKLQEYNSIYNKNYKNTRSIVSSIINSKDVDERIDYLLIVPLRTSYIDEDGHESQQELAPEVMAYPHLKCKLMDIDKIHDFAFNHKTVFPGLRCDGAVIHLLDKEIQKVLGREDEKQKYEVAFKFTEETAYSKVIDIEFTAGLFGRMIPVVKFAPIKMKGNTVEKASLGSYSRFKELELCKGDVIKVMYDIIPYVDFDETDCRCSRSGKDIISEPLICPDCGEILSLSEDGGILQCVNYKCPCREKGKILNFCKKMHIQQISYATIDDFYKAGLLTSIQDLYYLKNHVNEISQIQGYGANKITNIINEIENHNDVEASVFLGSLGIEGISTKKFKSILEFMSIDEIIDICKENNDTFFTAIPGIKEKTAIKLVNGIKENMELIEHIMKNNIINIIKDKQDGDFIVCFTMVRENDVDGLEELIEQAGGTINNDSLTKKTNILVVPATENIKSSKIDKANKYGIPIIPITEISDYIKNNYL